MSWDAIRYPQLNLLYLTFIFLVVTMTSPVRLVVRPCADGKLRRGGGGGGDLEGFSVRYLATLSSAVHTHTAATILRLSTARAC